MRKQNISAKYVAKHFIEKKNLVGFFFSAILEHLF